jgi:DNA repair ATPase RecN
VAEESEKGEQLRRNLIYQDFLNKGYTPEKAQKFTERTIDAGTDVEDAREALQSNKEFFQEAYNNLLREAQEKADAIKEERRQQAEQLKNSLMKDIKFLDLN